MKLVSLVAVSCFLVACSQVTDIQDSSENESSSSVASEIKMIEQVPKELSVNYFSTMTLSGSSFELGDVLERHDAYIRYAIRYKSNGLWITGIMNIPTGAGPFPLLIFNHGYIDPSIYTQGRGLRREQDYLAKRGFAVLHTDYRGHAGSDESPDVRKVYHAGLEYAMDSANAILAVRQAAIPKVDAWHVGMLGHSLGGGVTLNVLTGKPDLVDAAVLYAPVSADAWKNFMRWRSMREEGDRTRELMQTYEENPSAWEALSSKSMLSVIRAPVLLFHGTNDADVPFDWSVELTQWLQQQQKQIEFVQYEGEKHEFVREWPDFMSRTADFFDTHLRAMTIAPPIERSDERVLKKPFGIRITPEDSPVQPERFRGFHVGTDYEILQGEQAHDIEITASCDGEVIFSGVVDGYGGLVVQSCVLGVVPVTVLYGHLNPTSLTRKGTKVVVGGKIGVLGEGFSSETDGERSHLHFGIHKGTVLTYSGYVQKEGDLEQWIDAEELLDNH